MPHICLTWLKNLVLLLILYDLVEIGKYIGTEHLHEKMWVMHLQLALFILQW